MEFETEVKAMFDASVEVQPGNGTQTYFWTDKWLQGQSIQSLAPDLCRMVNTRTKNKRTLAQGLHNKQWIKDLTGHMTLVAFAQYLELCPLIQSTQLDQEAGDAIRWRGTRHNNTRQNRLTECCRIGAVQRSKANLEIMGTPKGQILPILSYAWKNVDSRTMVQTWIAGSGCVRYV